MSTSEQIRIVTQELEGQSLSALVAGFSFAAAMSWMDVSRWVISRVIKGSRNTGIQYTLTALMTTLLSVLVYLVVSTLSKRVKRPERPIYAISR